MVEEGVGNDERSLFAHDLADLVKRYGQTAFFDVNLFGCAEPEHVFPSFCNGFDVEEVLYTYVLGDRVAAPRAAAECERGTEHEVVNIAYAALRGGGVDEDAAGLHARGKFVELGFFLDGIKVDRRGVTVAAVGDEMLGFSEGILYVRGAVHCKHGRELFMGKFLGKLYRFYFAYEYLCALGHLYAGERGDRSRLLIFAFSAPFMIMVFLTRSVSSGSRK